jgi:hypothetical protein
MVKTHCQTTDGYAHKIKVYIYYFQPVSNQTLLLSFIRLSLVATLAKLSLSAESISVPRWRYCAKNKTSHSSLIAVFPFATPGSPMDSELSLLGKKKKTAHE